tara:strand:- start:196 stop:786 length:591 start_codon:yes stop_codon:yes gene_type:complete
MDVNLRKITGNWDDGVVLDKHTIRSVLIGHDEYGHPKFDTTRTQIGEALYQLKYGGDWAQVGPLAQELANSAFPLFPNIGLIVPVPPSKQRLRQPVYEIAAELARLKKLSSFEQLVLRAPAAAGAPQLKNLNSKEEKVAALAGRLSISDTINGQGKWNALVVDDLYDTGASIEAVCATLKTYPKIDKIYVAALTWR